MPAVDHDEVVNVALIENLQRFGRQGLIRHTNRVARHHPGQRACQDVIIGCHVPAQVAIGKDADQFAAGVDHADAAGLGAGHHQERLLDAQGLLGHGVARVRPHDIADPQEQGASDGAGRMMAGKVLLLEPARLEHGHGQGVAQDEHGRRAGGRREVKGAGFLGDLHLQDHVAVPGHGGFYAAGQRDDSHGKALERREQVDQFLRLPGITEGEHEVAVVDDAKVAVERIDTVEHDAGRAGAGEGGGDFLPDVARLADADDHDLAPAPQRVHDQFHRPVESLVELGAHRLERGQFDVEDVAGAGQVTHRRRGCQGRLRDSMTQCRGAID